MITDARGLLDALGPEREYGTWLVIDNRYTSFAPHKPGWHPWVLVQPSDATRPRSIAYPRSKSAVEGIVHPPHPHPPHACRIEDEGRIVMASAEALSRDLIVATPIECVEPDPALLRSSFKSGRR